MDLKYKKINELDGDNYRTVLRNYKFSKEDALHLKSIETLATLHTKKLLEGFYKFIFEFNHAKIFLDNKDILARHEKGIEQWYKNLFCGKYEEEYFEKLHFLVRFMCV